MRSLVRSVSYIAPEIVFQCLEQIDGVIFLDSSMQHQYYGRYSILLLNPLETFCDIHLISQKYSALLLQNDTDNNELPFIAGFAGYINYELGYEFEPCLKQNCHANDNICLGLYNQAIVFDVIQRQAFIIVTPLASYNYDYALQLDNLDKLYCTIVNQSNHMRSNQDIILPQLEFRASHSQADYMRMVDTVREHILSGDIFQANLAQTFSASLPNEYPVKLLYNKLRKINPAPFAAFVNLNNTKILSASPERFIHIKNGMIETRPIKGTIRRSNDTTTDNQYATLLAQSIKDRAENIMIVDLMRNDLSKICTSESIEVTKLCQIESFTNLHHLVSVVQGRLSDNINLANIMRALFPGGSITGAPKIRAMEIIAKLEAQPRHIYCGSIGYFSLNGNVDLSIAIRTILIKNNQLSFSAGCGITLDSDPAYEYQESLLKAQKLREALA